MRYPLLQKVLPLTKYIILFLTHLIYFNNFGAKPNKCDTFFEICISKLKQKLQRKTCSHRKPAHIPKLSWIQFFDTFKSQSFIGFQCEIDISGFARKLLD